MKQQKRKKLIIYSVFAWGSPFMLAIICDIMDFVPGIPNNFRSNFRNRCWFDGNMTYLLYFHGVAITSFISSICLCICTAQKIAYYEKDIAHHLKDSENRCYNNNKQWFKLHLEMTKVLFIICIKWYMYAIQVLNYESSLSVWYVYCALEVIEHFCIFLIFVWKKRTVAVETIRLAELQCFQ